MTPQQLPPTASVELRAPHSKNFWIDPLVIPTQKIHLSLDKDQSGTFLFAASSTPTLHRNISVTLNSGSRIDIVGIFPFIENASWDFTVHVHHQGSHSQSRTFLYGILGQNTNMKVTGTLNVASSAAESQSHFESKVLFTETSATAQITPNLEVSQKNVQASHAVAMGHVDPDMLFYLQSRGISQAEAEKLLYHGFLSTVLTRVPDIASLMKKV